MSLHNVSPGARAPEEFNVIIEIPMNADPIKYEVDEETGALFVDRFMGTAMHYPCNYGYIPQTLADDGDPVDVLVVTPYPLIPGVVVTCRPLGMLKMNDEAGGDNKLLAVPIDKVLSIYTHWQKPDDMNALRLNQIQHDEFVVEAPLVRVVIGRVNLVRICVERPRRLPRAIEISRRVEIRRHLRIHLRDLIHVEIQHDQVRVVVVAPHVFLGKIGLRR